MISSAGTRGDLWRLWAALVTILLMVWVTLWLTQIAVKPMRMTPLSGLMALKTMANEAMPYEAEISSSRPTFIEFYADGCTTCQSMSATVTKLHQQYGEQINFVRLNINDPNIENPNIEDSYTDDPNIDDPQWATRIARYQALGMPQFTLIDAAQNPLDTWVGKVSEPIFTNAFERVLANAST